MASTNTTERALRLHTTRGGWRHLAPALLLLGAFGRPATAHAAGQGGLVREFLAQTGHRMAVTLHRELGGLVEGLWSALWGETIGHASQHACAGLAVWDLAALALIAALVFAVVRVRNQTSRKRLDVARRMVEQGIEPPGDLLGDTTSGDLRRGVVLIFTGMGLLAASWAGGAAGHGPPSSAGLIPGFIGLGYLASHWLTRTDAGRRTDARSSAGAWTGAAWSDAEEDGG